MVKRFFVFFLFFLFFISFTQKAKATTTIDCNDAWDVDNYNGRLFITEFNPTAISEQYVEFINTLSSANIDLTGCTLEIYDNTNTLSSTVNLTGTIPQTALLTNDLNSTPMDAVGGKLIWKWGDGTAVFTITYGSVNNGTWAGAIPDADKSYSVDGHDSTSWSNSDAKTKGWCNLNGFGDCPVRASVASQIAASGVSTNLGDAADWTKIEGLYFEMPGKGRIEFLSTINFTDQNSLSWLQTMNTNIDMDESGKIGLNADLIKNLVSTNASLTMYGLTLNNPKILVDNADDTGGVVSSITYNRSAGTLTFNAAHFTTFTAVENNTALNTALNTAGAAPGCGDARPYKAPYLYQIDTKGTSADLYFVPAGDPVSYHYISYGYTEGDERFGVQVNVGHSTGAIKYTINHLSPNTTYYFKVRGGNGCMPGNWSNYLSAKTVRSQGSYYAWKPANNISKASLISAKPTAVKTKNTAGKENRKKVLSFDIKNLFGSLFNLL